LTQKCSDFHAGLDVSEDIVDQKQHIAMLVITEVFSHGERCAPDPKPGARGFIHLPVDHHHIVEDTRIPHGAIELFSFAASLANATENTHALLVPDHIVDRFGKQNCLAYPGPTEQACFATAFQGHKDVDCLNACLEYLRFGGSLRQWGWWTMNVTPLNIGGGWLVVECNPKNVEHA
jgi:hypothetical protein